jgi:hypothetical protein
VEDELPLALLDPEVVVGGIDTEELGLVLVL